MTKWQYAEVYAYNQNVVILGATAEGSIYNTIPFERKESPDDALRRCIGAMGNEGWELFQIDVGGNRHYHLKRSY